MPLLTSRKTQPQYDVIVVGSGAGGGQTAYTLAMEGAKVLMLEAGRSYDPASETPMFQLPHQAPLNGAKTTDKWGGFYDSTLDGGWQVPGEPYTSASDDPQRKFLWWRARMLGGRTNHWGRISLRNGPLDFKPYQRDSLGFDWPIGYEDVAPYYDKVEMLIGVYGTNEPGLENTPHSPAGVLLPPPAFRAGESYIQHHSKKVGVPIMSTHRAVLTQRQDPQRLAPKLHPNNPKAQRILTESMNGRAACFWATHCSRGCSIRATYQSTTVHLPPALATGNLDILPNAMAREVTTDDAGRATGVVYVDKTTGEEGRVQARVVVLAASAAETVRIMLNSRSNRFPDGIGNSSGLVGKYIMDTVGANLEGQIPALENLPPHHEDGAGGDHVYAPWWLYREQRRGQLDFPRGYHIEFSSGRQMPQAGITDGWDRWLTRGGYGARFKDDVRRYYGSLQRFAGRGEMIPNDDCFAELDPTLKDKWGIPVLRFHWKWAEHETRQVRHMQETFAAMFEAMGGKLKSPPAANGRDAIEPGGRIIHEVGGAIMGADPGKSVTDRWSRTWDVPNFYLTDGAPFASNADKNPTLTIMALAWRAADHILDQLKKGDL